MSDTFKQEMAALQSNCRLCTSADAARVVSTLAESDYQGVANLLGLDAELTKSTLLNLDKLGRLPTCFATLGSYLAQNLHNEPRFRICQAAKILNYEEKVGDGKKQMSLRFFKDKIARGEELGETIVLLKTPKKLAIIACNTRAIAMYDVGIEREVEVFIIASTMSQTDEILVP